MSMGRDILYGFVRPIWLKVVVSAMMMNSLIYYYYILGGTIVGMKLF